MFASILLYSTQTAFSQFSMCRNYMHRQSFGVFLLHYFAAFNSVCCSFRLFLLHGFFSEIGSAIFLSSTPLLVSYSFCHIELVPLNGSERYIYCLQQPTHSHVPRLASTCKILHEKGSSLQLHHLKTFLNDYKVSPYFVNVLSWKHIVNC